MARVDLSLLTLGREELVLKAPLGDQVIEIRALRHSDVSEVDAMILARNVAIASGVAADEELGPEALEYIRSKAPDPFTLPTGQRVPRASVTPQTIELASLVWEAMQHPREYTYSEMVGMAVSQELGPHFLAWSSAVRPGRSLPTSDPLGSAASESASDG